MVIEFIMSGAKQILEESVKCKAVIDHGSVLLMHKANDQAKNQLKLLLPDQGFKRWLLIRFNWSQKMGQRLEAEFDALTHLVKLKISDMPNSVTLLVR